MATYTDSRHAHQLTLNAVSGRVCDICRGKSPSFYQCGPCGFDMCQPCFTKNNPTPTTSTPSVSASSPASGKVGGVYADSRHTHPLTLNAVKGRACDICRGSSPMFYQCGSCGFDLCQPCFTSANPNATPIGTPSASSSSSASSSAPSAGAGSAADSIQAGTVINDSRHQHGLTCILGSEVTRHSCDVCKAKSTQFFVCRQCNWDLCKACYDKVNVAKSSTPASPSSAASSALVVTDSRHAHPLTWREDMPRHSCDVCRQQPGKFFECKACDWDLCKKCYDRGVAESKVASAPAVSASVASPSSAGASGGMSGVSGGRPLVINDSRHKHELSWRENMSRATCDLCRGGGGKFYVCDECNWDMCPKCYEKGDAPSATLGVENLFVDNKSSKAVKQQQPKQAQPEPVIEAEPAPGGVEQLTDPRHVHQVTWRTLAKSTECSVCDRKRRAVYECKDCNWIMCPGCAKDKPLSKGEQAAFNVQYLLELSQSQGTNLVSQIVDKKFKVDTKYPFFDGRKIASYNIAQLGILEAQAAVQDASLSQFAADIKAKIAPLQASLEVALNAAFNSALSAAIAGEEKEFASVAGRDEIEAAAKLLPADRATALLSQWAKDEDKAKADWTKDQKIAQFYKKLKKGPCNFTRVRPGPPEVTGLPYRELIDERTAKYWDTWRKPYAGKILFAKSNIEQMSDPASTAVKSFIPGDEVFGRAIWPVSIRNMPIGRDSQGKPVYGCDWILADSYGHVVKHMLIIAMRVMVNGNIVARDLDKNEMPEGGYLSHFVEVGPIPPGSSRSFSNQKQHQEYKLDPKLTDFYAWNQSVSLKVLGKLEEGSKWKAGIPMLSKKLSTLKAGTHKVRVDIVYWIKGRPDTIDDWRKWGSIKGNDDVPYDYTYISHPIATGEFDFVITDESKLSEQMKADPMPQRKTTMSEADADKFEKQIFNFMSKHRDWGGRSPETETVMLVRVEDWGDYGIDHGRGCPKINCRCPRQWGLNYKAAMYRSPLGKWNKERPIAIFDLTAYSYEKGVLADAFQIGVAMADAKQIDCDSVPEVYWQTTKRCPPELRDGVV